jgi:hypothetical protein
MEGKHENAEEPSKGKTAPCTNNNIFSLQQVSTFWQGCQHFYNTSAWRNQMVALALLLDLRGYNQSDEPLIS